MSAEHAIPWSPALPVVGTGPAVRTRIVAEELTHPLSTDVFARFRAGDPDALARIVEVLHSRVIAFARLYTRDVGIAEEVAQDTFLDAWRQRTSINGREALRPWLFTVAKRRALRAVSRRGMRDEFAVGDVALERAAPLLEPVQERGLLGADVQRAIAGAMAGLDPVEQDLVTLRFFADLPLREIAVALRMPIGTVGTKLSRVLGKMRRSLEAQGLSPEELLP